MAPQWEPTQDGVNFAYLPAQRNTGVLEIASALPSPVAVIASGGLSNMADIEQLCAVEDEGVEGVICGRAIYSGDLDFQAAQARADELEQRDAEIRTLAQEGQHVATLEHQ